nr:MAG TPA: hypothetical protein [Caudoviricetes sp.]
MHDFSCIPMIIMEPSNNLVFSFAKILFLMY